MKTLLPNYRQTLLERALSLLWRQWALLGIAGHDASDTEGQFQIIDPESLLLITTELGRFDARLMDEVTNWLRKHGKLINIQRLKGIHEQYKLGNARVLAAMAATLLQNSRQAKWKAVRILAKPQGGKEPLFRNPDGTPLPVFGRPDPYFESFGLFRGVQQVRDNASDPAVQCPDLLLVKLRALIGVNARAEIITALLTTQSAHASGLARRTGYLPRSIQDILNEMALSGHVMKNRPKGSREKYFLLRPGDWTFLITWPQPKFPRWVDWAIVFALLQDLLRMLFDEATRSNMATALRSREIFDEHYPALLKAGLADRFSGTVRESGIKFLESFLEEIINI